MSFKGINVLGVQVPTDHVRLCFFDARQVMIGDKRVLHIGWRPKRYSVMVTDRGQFYGTGPAVHKQFRLSRTNAESLYPMTPELKAGQDFVDRTLFNLHA